MSQKTIHPHGAVARYLARAQRHLATEATRILFRKRITVRIAVPLVSFTFDDFPRSAFLEAGSILRRYGVLGTSHELEAAIRATSKRPIIVQNPLSGPKRPTKSWPGSAAFANVFLAQDTRSVL